MSFWCAVSGFGQYGPYKDRPSFDPLGQAMSGLMSLTGIPVGRPIGTAFSVVDRTTALHATIGALAALRHRDQTGEGQVIDVCLMDSALTMVEIPACYYLDTGEEGGESGRPPYQAKDGWVVVTGGVTPKLGQRLAEMIGQSATATQKPGGSLFGHNNPVLTEWCKQHTVADICEKLLALGIPVAPVLSIPQVVKDPHLWQREMLVKVKTPRPVSMHVPGIEHQVLEDARQAGSRADRRAAYRRAPVEASGLRSGQGRSIAGGLGNSVRRRRSKSALPATATQMSRLSRTSIHAFDRSSYIGCVIRACRSRGLREDNGSDAGRRLE